VRSLFSQIDRDTDSLSETARELATRGTSHLTAPWLLRSCPGPDASVQDSVIATTPFCVGRRSENDLCISGPTVSGKHAELFFVNKDLFVRDLNSTNGTFVNGQRISDIEQLRDGDLLQLGTAKLQVFQKAQAVSSATVSADVAGQALAHFQFDKLIAEPAVIPHFQPIVRLSDSAVVGYEILGRSRLMGLETPAKMFRVAAERSLECSLSRVLRREGLRVGSVLGTEITLYVNTHPEELHDEQLFDSLQILRDDNPRIPIILEVHEAAVTSSHFLAGLRQQLNDLEIGLAYDDFGAGQARLVELSDVPPDVIKFDLQLVHGLGQASNERRRVVGALVAMVRDLGVIPLAEGVELQKEADVCRELGFELAQGYLFGRPAPINTWLSTSPDVESVKADF